MTKKKPVSAGVAYCEADVRDTVEGLVVGAGSMRALAREWGMSPAYLGDFLNGRRGPGPQILKPLGLVQVVTIEYRKGTSVGRQRRAVASGK